MSQLRRAVRDMQLLGRRVGWESLQGRELHICSISEKMHQEWEQGPWGCNRKDVFPRD